MTHIKHRKIINGHVYRLERGMLTKKFAVRSAKAHRNVGHLARVAKFKTGDSTTYAVYVSLEERQRRKR